MKKKVIIILFLIIALLIYKETKEEAVIIPDTAIRLRVIPNSNSIEDQNIKSKVKNYLETDIYKLLENVEEKEEAKNIIKENIPTIEENINTIFKENNYNLNYEVNYGNNYFPSKKYRGIKYEEGYYESIIIKIGNGEGDNFWCVLFPNLCLVDLEQKNDVEYKSWVVERISKIF